jgi:hypothetical protein
MEPITKFLFLGALTAVFLWWWDGFIKRKKKRKK